MNLKGKRIVVYDLETNGFSPTANQPIQVATMTVQDKVVLDRQQWFVVCGTPIPWRITELTGIRDTDLIGGMSLPDTAQRLYDILRPESDLLLIGHNIMRFDNRFVEHLWSVYLGIDLDLAPYCYDTLAWTRVDRNNLIVPVEQTTAWQKSVLYQNIRGPACNLTAACLHYGVAVEEHHRAHNDVEASWAIAQQQWQQRETASAGLFEDETGFLSSFACKPNGVVASLSSNRDAN